MPAAEYKTGQTHTVPLSEAAIAILDRMRLRDPVYVFGSGKSKPPGKETTRNLMAKVHTSATPHGL